MQKELEPLASICILSFTMFWFLLDTTLRAAIALSFLGIWTLVRLMYK
jgi:hypothetical protein